MSETLSNVVDCIAATTRYPKHLLTPEADLESDLGIDSVKRVEIVIALGQTFGLDLHTEKRDPTVKTIADIARWIDQRLTNDANDRQGTPNVDDPHNGSSDQETSLIKRDREHRNPPSPNFIPVQPSGGNGRNHDSQSSNQEINGTKRRSDSDPLERPKPQAHDAAHPERVVFVTGSGRGIGQTIARAFAAQGDTVIVNSFHSRDAGERAVATINEAGGKAIHLWGSIANPEHVEQIFQEIENQFGHLDVMVCNASDGKIGSFLELTAEDWDRAFRTNVSGHHQCAVHAARLMQPVGGGAIVTISAVGAHHHVEGLGSQGVVKAAVESLTKYLASELAPFGVRVNCVVGGPVYGELISKFENADRAQHLWESLSPDRELSSPLDIVNTIEFLVSEKARGINGAIWNIDHGFASKIGQQSLRGFQVPINS